MDKARKTPRTEAVAAEEYYQGPRVAIQLDIADAEVQDRGDGLLTLLIPAQLLPQEAVDGLSAFVNDLGDDTHLTGTERDALTEALSEAMDGFFARRWITDRLRVAR